MRAAIGLLLVPAALAAAVGQALSGLDGEGFPSSRVFSIDGIRFSPGGPSGNSLSVVERELAKRGIDTVPVSASLRSAVDPGAVEPLREEPETIDAPPLPGGLKPEHFLRLQTATGPVELAFGHMDRARGDILRRLRADGWECKELDAHGAPGTIAQLSGRKEASVVLLEEAEGRFLSIRRPVR